MSLKRVFGYAWDAGKSSQVVFTSNSHIHELHRVLGQPWKHDDLTAAAGDPPGGDLVDAYAWEAGKSKQVVYLAGGGRIHMLYVTLGGAWHHADLTGITKAPPVAADLINGYAWETGNSEQVVFGAMTAGHIHIHELSRGTGSRWYDADLTKITGAPPAIDVANGYAWEVEQTKQIVYNTSEGYIHELSGRVGAQGTIWNHADLTISACAPPAAFIVNGYAWEAGNSKQVVFTIIDHPDRIHELYAVPGGKYDAPTGVWNHADLTEITGAPPARSVLNGYAWEAGKSKQVVFATDDLHIHELTAPLEGTWSHADLTALAGAPPAIDVLDFRATANSYAWESGKSKHVVYIGQDEHIHELWTLGGKWNDLDLTEVTGAPLPD